MGHHGFLLSISLFVATLAAVAWTMHPGAIVIAVATIFWLSSSLAILTDATWAGGLTLIVLSASLIYLSMGVLYAGGVLLAALLLISTFADIACIATYDTI